MVARVGIEITNRNSSHFLTTKMNKGGLPCLAILVDTYSESYNINFIERIVIKATF